MLKPRDFDKHLQFYTAFALAVSAFDATTWDRIRARCAAFDAVSVFAAFERAQIRALPNGSGVSHFVAEPTYPLRLLAGISTVVQTGIALAFELTQLVPEWRESASIPPQTSALNPRAARYAAADYMVNHTLDSLPGPSLGVRAAMHAAGAAVLHHDFLSDHDFTVCYEVVAPELSFAELERRVNFV